MTASTLRLENCPAWVDDLGDRIPPSIFALADGSSDDGAPDAPKGAHRILTALQSGATVAEALAAAVAQIQLQQHADRVVPRLGQERWQSRWQRRGKHSCKP